MKINLVPVAGFTSGVAAVLKLTGIVSWSWTVVLMPIVIIGAIFITTLVFTTVVLGFVALSLKSGKITVKRVNK